MVFFTCNLCGDSLKKNRVNIHVQQCSTSNLTCLDCNQDFSLNSYATHIECLTENQKYGGENAKTQNFKGKARQNEWVKKIKLAVEKNTYPKDVQFILNSLVNFDNIPRKKSKFFNFIKNSFKIKNENLIDKIWSIFESSIRTDFENGFDQKKNQNKCVENLKLTKPFADQNDLNILMDKKPKNEEMGVRKLRMKKIISEILKKYDEISYSKLQKKVLRYYNNNNYDNDQDILELLEKKVHKKKFIFIDDCVKLANKV